MLAERYRASIIAELTAYYRQAMSMERSTSRVGVLLCFLQEFRVNFLNIHIFFINSALLLRTMAFKFFLQRAERLLQTDYEIFHMLGTFDNETVTYKLGIR